MTTEAPTALLVKYATSWLVVIEYPNGARTTVGRHHSEFKARQQLAEFEADGYTIEEAS